MQTLNLSSCNISGGLPLTWGSEGALPALVELDLGNNSVNGSLPTTWSASNSLPELTTLGLSNNSLTGALPASWGSQAQAFPSLEVLEVSYNGLGGTLPASWCGSGFPVSPLLLLLLAAVPRSNHGCMAGPCFRQAVKWVAAEGHAFQLHCLGQRQPVACSQHTLTC